MQTTLSPDYEPSEDEDFMNPSHLAFFHQRLLAWKADLVRDAGETLSNLTEGNLQQPDMADRASLETDHQIELRTRDRERKLISKINKALGRIEDGSFGYCEETDEPIGLRFWIRWVVLQVECSSLYTFLLQCGICGRLSAQLRSAWVYP